MAGQSRNTVRVQFSLLPGELAEFRRIALSLAEPGMKENLSLAVRHVLRSYLDAEARGGGRPAQAAEGPTMSSPPNPGVPLFAGPYTPPRGRAFRMGRTVGDRIRGEVEVCGVSDAPIPWPLARTRAHARPLPIVAGDLERGSGRSRSKRSPSLGGVPLDRPPLAPALGVGRITPGSAALWTKLARKLHTPLAREHQPPGRPGGTRS